MFSPSHVIRKTYWPRAASFFVSYFRVIAA